MTKALLESPVSPIYWAVEVMNSRQRNSVILKINFGASSSAIEMTPEAAELLADRLYKKARQQINRLNGRPG
jgi:hypothetical protein